MSSSLLELSRVSHEDVERLEIEVVKNMIEEAKTHKETILQAHKISKLIDETNNVKKKLISIYEDTEGTRKEEIDSIGGSGQAIYSLFYEKLRDIKEYHRKFPNQTIDPPSEFSPQLELTELPFTTEEGLGKFLDLHNLHQMFNNLPFMHGAPIDYLTYLSTFYKFTKQRLGKGAEYLSYLDALMSYLISHRRRSQPLEPLDDIISQFESDFDNLIKNNPPPTSSSSSTSADHQNNNNNNGNDKNGDTSKVDSEMMINENINHTSSSSDNNNNNNSNKRKNAAANNSNNNITKTMDVNIWAEENPKFSPLKAFNNPKYCRECCKFFPDVINAKHNKSIPHKKRKKKNAVYESKIALLEYKIHRIAQLVDEVIENTKIYVETKLAMRYEEILADMEMDEDVASDSESDDEEELTRRCIANYPVGWDGKPIPYWLYKLHGLGIEYKCEICGNTSYWGRRAFERHFQEWRHAYGMRCLGIPNTKQFNDITNINDALSLWEKIKRDEKQKEWNPDDLEECEDSEGNVLSKKTFLDLQRQGLLDI